MSRLHEVMLGVGLAALAIGCPFVTQEQYNQQKKSWGDVTDTQDDEGDADTDADGDADADADGDADADPQVSVAWDKTAVTLTITNGSGTYWWGIVETIDAAKDPWTGEDCLYGYGKWQYCHPTSATGVTLAYGAAVDTVVEGETTLFSNPGYAASVTYSLWESRSETCLGAWGEDPSYYSGHCADWGPSAAW